MTMKDSADTSYEKDLSGIDEDMLSCESGEEDETSTTDRRQSRSRTVSRNNSCDEVKPKRGRGRPLKCFDEDSENRDDTSTSRSQSDGRPARKRGRPQKYLPEDFSQTTKNDADESNVSRKTRSRSRSQSIARPKRNSRKPKKLLSESSYSEFSETSGHEDEGEDDSSNIQNESGSQSSFVLRSDVEETKSGHRNCHNSSRRFLRREKESGESVKKESSTSAKKRKLSSDTGPRITGDKDVFCWQCHRDGGNMVICHGCPRSYHKRCVKVDVQAENWICVECNTTMVAGSYLNESQVRSLPQDELNQLFKFTMERVYSHEGAEHFKDPVDLVEYPSYKDYIIHPMDLTLIEKNINNSVYKTTESFVADMKWLVHNSYIFNSAYSELTAYARAILKIVKQEADEIDNCPHCYFHYHTMEDDTWFVEPCKKPHLIVWAKLRGFPHWPAKVMRIVNDLVDVRFFGDHNRSWLSPDCCYLFSKSSPFTNKLGEQSGYSECIKEVFIHIKKLKLKFSEFCFAPFRVKYMPEHHEDLLLDMLPLLNSTSSSGEGSLVKTVSPISGSPLKHINGVSKLNKSSVNLCLETASTAFTQKDVDGAVSSLGEDLSAVDKPFKLNESPKKGSDSSGKLCDEEEIKEEIFDGDSNNENRSTDLYSGKKPKVVLTRIHFEGKLYKESSTDPACVTDKPLQTNSQEEENSTKINDYMLKGNDTCRQASLSGCGVNAEENSSPIKANVSTVESDTDKKKDSVTHGSNKIIMLKLKPSAELLSTEALKKHNANTLSESRIEGIGANNDDSLSNIKQSNLLTTSLGSHFSEAGTSNGSKSFSKLKDTIEKVVRGDVNINTAVVNKKSKSMPESKPCNDKSLTSSQMFKKKSTETNRDSESSEDSISLDTIFKEEEASYEGDLNISCDNSALNDVANWLAEGDFKNSTVSNLIVQSTLKCEQSQSLEDCKKALSELKRLVFLQTQEIVHYSDKIKNEAKEVFEIMVVENQKLTQQKKWIADNLKNLKLNQWCKFCLKEACFYCCWGTSYCSKNCQIKDWDVHFTQCKQSDKLVEENIQNKLNLPPSITINKIQTALPQLPSSVASNPLTITKTVSRSEPRIVKVSQPGPETVLKNSVLTGSKLAPTSGASSNSSVVTFTKPVIVVSNNKSPSVFNSFKAALKSSGQVVQILRKPSITSDRSKLYLSREQLKSIVDVSKSDEPPVDMEPPSQPTKSNTFLSNASVQLVNNNASPTLLQTLPSSVCVTQDKPNILFVQSPEKNNINSISPIELSAVSSAS